jgi:subtilisin family serine protease
VLIIAAAGNYPAGNPDGIDLPAGFEEVIAVGATTIFNSRTVYPTTALIPETLADYSKTGPEMELTAPGTHIITLLGSSGYTTDSDIQFKGTSAATPLISGFAALLASHFPSYTNQQLRSMMHHSVVDMGTPGFDEYYGYGRIDMVKAFRDHEPPVIELVGDTNGDGVVGDGDLEEVFARYGARKGMPDYLASADTNKDDIIDELDIFLIGLNWGKTRDDP